MVKTNNKKPKFGGAMRDRTADLFAASEALSQLSYSPACLNVLIKRNNSNGYI
tara:strand:+ start:1665 stop:1823 length:159 start_codon:yes stop_codon:yes gene_type:complete